MTNPISEPSVLMRKARALLENKWKLAASTGLVYCLMLWGPNVIPFVGYISILILGGPMALGYAMLGLNIIRRNDLKFDYLFDGFKQFGNALSAYLLMMVYTLLWMLLFIIPGIIVSILIP